MEESKMEESKMEESKMEESKMEESKMEESKMAERKRQTRRTEIKKIEKKSACATTFTKRRQGLFRKTQKLCTSYGANAAVVLFSPQLGKPYSYGHPSVDSVMERFLKDNDESSASTANSTSASREHQQGIRVEHRETATLESNAKGGGVHVRADWWNESLEGMDLDELNRFRDSLCELKKNLLAQIKEIKNRERCLRHFF